MVINTDLDIQIIELEKWLKSNPHLPQSIDVRTLQTPTLHVREFEVGVGRDSRICAIPTYKLHKELLKRFLNAVSGDLEKAKKLIELNYTMRNKNPHIFLNRDPTDEASKQILRMADLVPLPGMTPDKSKVLLYRLIDFNPDKFMFTDGVKMFFMMADCRFATPDECGMSEGEIPVFDMTGFTLGHLRRTVFSSLRVYMKFVQEAHPVRLKQIHVLNCPSYLDKVMTVVRPFIKSEVLKLIKFHLPGSTTIYDYLPQEMFPEEYGGANGKMSDLKNTWIKNLENQRDYLMDSKHWKMNEIEKKSCKRSSSLTSNRLLDMSNLNID